MFEIIGIVSIVSALAAYLLTNKIVVAGIGVLLVLLLIYCIILLFVKQSDSKSAAMNISVIPLLATIIIFILIKITYLMD